MHSFCMVPWSPDRHRFCHSSARIIAAVLIQTATALYCTMPSSMKYTNYHNTLCTLFLLSHPIAGAGFFPRYIATDQTISRRVCDPAAPDVSESSVCSPTGLCTIFIDMLQIIADVCTHTLADDFPTCSDQMWALRSTIPASLLC